MENSGYYLHPEEINYYGIFYQRYLGTEYFDLYRILDFPTIPIIRTGFGINIDMRLNFYVFNEIINPVSAREDLEKSINLLNRVDEWRKENHNENKFEILNKIVKSYELLSKHSEFSEKLELVRNFQWVKIVEN